MSSDSLSLIDAAVYLRMSTDRQTPSPDRQREQIEPYAAARGYRIVITYLDSGIEGSGQSERPEFDRMMRDALSGKFKVILCDELSRLSRYKPNQFAALVSYPLEEAGVFIDSVAEGQQDPDDIVSYIKAGLYQDKASSEVRNMARRVATGRASLTAKGINTATRPLYGYKFVPHELYGKVLVGDGTIKEEAAKLAFRLIDEGGTLSTVQAEMRKRGIPSPSGSPFWSNTGLRKLLRNPRYCGDHVSGQTSQGKYCRIKAGRVIKKVRGQWVEDRKGRDGKDIPVSEPKGPAVVRPPEDWQVVPDIHEALVSREQFARVQAALKSNQERTTPHEGGGPFLLSKMLYCSHCESLFIGRMRNGRVCYECGGSIRKGTAHCHANRVRQDELVKLIADELQAHFLSPEKLDAMRADARRLHAEESSSAAVDAINSQISDQRKKLARVEKQLDWCEDKGNFRRLEGERAAAAAEVGRLEGELARVSQASRIVELEEVIAAMERDLFRLHEVLLDESTEPMQRRAALRECISWVDLRFHWKQCAERVVTKLIGGTIHTTSGDTTLRRPSKCERAPECSRGVSIPFVVNGAA